MDSKRSRRQTEIRQNSTLMRRLIAGFRLRLDDELRDRHVTAAQVRFLYELKQKPGITGAQLARACFITPQSAQAMTMRAVRAGWVLRGKDPENERLVTARLTAAGERLLAIAEEMFAALEGEVWRDVRTREFRALNEVLERGLKRLEP